MTDVKILNGHNIKDEVARTTKQDIIQYSAFPLASAARTNKIYQYIGQNNANYTFGYFYKCVLEDGVYKWKQLDVQPSGSSPVSSSSTEYIDGEYINIKRAMVPSEYTLVEYIESNGTGYINVGESRAAAPKILIEFTNNGTAPSTGSYLLGAGNDNTNFLSLVLVNDGYNGYNINGVNTTTASGAEYDVITLTLIEGYQKNGDASVSLTGLSNISPKNLYLFSGNNNDTALTPYASARVKRLTLWNLSGVQTVNFVPVKRKSDNVAGFYDTVRKAFYTCAGLTAGSETIINQITIEDKVLRNTTSVSNGLAVSTGVTGEAAQAGSNATAVGVKAKAQGTGALAYGYNANASATNATAVGQNARATAANAIQIGTGTNSTAGTIQIKNWQLLDVNGYIPEERLPLGLRSTGANPTNLYALDESDVSQQAYLYTGDTNSFLTKDRYYRGTIWNSRPIFEVTGVEPTMLQAITDVKIDQQKLFEKIAAVSKDRIDNDDIANSIVGGDDSIQSVIFGYNATTHLWFIYFEYTGFESVYQSVPSEIADITETELENDYGVYINKEHFVPVAGTNDVFYVDYWAPNYCTSIGYDEADFTINYMKFMTAMCSNAYGFGYAIPNMETWSYVVDGTTYTMPVIPNEYNGYSDVTVRFEWDGMQTWEIIINGDSTGEFASTDLLEVDFGINIESGAEQTINYIEMSFEPAKQRRWEQFVPATAGNGITLEGGVVALEDNIVTDVKIHNVSKVVNKVADLSVVEQVTEFPNVTLYNAGLIVQYIGNTTSDFVHAYFYEALIILQHRTTTNYGIRIYDQTRFANFLKQDVESEGKNVSYFTVNRDSQSNLIQIRCYSTDGPFSTVHSYTDSTFPTTGLTADETVGGAIATFSTGYDWTQVDVQPKEDYTAITGFDSTVKQMLVHDANSSTLKWETIA